MNFSLQGQIALVSGAGRGNGAAIALGLATAGASVVVTDIDQTLAETTVATISRNGGRAWSYQLDVSDAMACQLLAGRVEADCGNVSILVNNAGILLRGTITSANAPDVWRKTMEVNVNGPFNLSRALLATLKATRGCIVNVASIQSFVGAKTSAAYAASKGAVAQLTRTLAVELAQDGIRVNAIAPGMINTPMSAESRANEERMAQFMRHVPMARCAEPEELAGPVVFLASAAASYITGAVLPVDGGYLVV